MKGNKGYKQEFANTIKRYNQDLLEHFEEIKEYKRPPINLISDIINALKNNYAKFESFHKQEIVFKEAVTAKIESELKAQKAKYNKLLNASKEEMSSYE